MYHLEDPAANWRNASPESALAAIVERGKQVGANGILGLKITPIIDNAKLIGYTVSGMLIKR